VIFLRINNFIQITKNNQEGWQSRPTLFCISSRKADNALDMIPEFDRKCRRAGFTCKQNSKIV
jgi:hypothetical protein